MIEHYSFGRIVIDGKEYTKDLIIYPDKIRANWWRKEGHKLHIEDIKEVLEYKPEILIVGTGYSGFMEVSKQVKEEIEKRNIKLIVEKTKEACKIYNQLYKKHKVVAALHLTC